MNPIRFQGVRVLQGGALNVPYQSPQSTGVLAALGAYFDINSEIKASMALQDAKQQVAQAYVDTNISGDGPVDFYALGEKDNTRFLVVDGEEDIAKLSAELTQAEAAVKTSAGDLLLDQLRDYFDLNSEVKAEQARQDVLNRWAAAATVVDLTA